MNDPDRLKDANIRITKLSDKHQISIPGYKFAFTIEGVIFLGASLPIISFFMYNASDSGQIIRMSIILFIILFFTLLMHSSTIIQFSKKDIKVKYGWLPFVRSRKTNNLKNIYIDFGDGMDSECTTKYLVLSFSKGWKIRIIVDQLSRKERDFLTGRLSYLMSKYSKEQV